jgi:hypothetical protein
MIWKQYLIDGLIQDTILKHISIFEETILRESSFGKHEKRSLHQKISLSMVEHNLLIVQLV